MSIGTIFGTPSIIVGSFGRFSGLLLTSNSRLDKFLPHAEEFGFFLHISTFRTSAFLAFPLGHPSRPTPGLLHTVHLFGIHFLQPESLHAREAPLLKRAVQFVATDLLGSHPDKITHGFFWASLSSYLALPVRLSMPSPRAALCPDYTILGGRFTDFSCMSLIYACVFPALTTFVKAFNLPAWVHQNCQYDPQNETEKTVHIFFSFPKYRCLCMNSRTDRTIGTVPP